MRAVITVIGQDNIGIVAKFSTVCADYKANIIDVTQKILDGIFTMIMLVDLEKVDKGLEAFKKELEKVGTETNLQVHVMHEDIFNAMHRI